MLLASIVLLLAIGCSGAIKTGSFDPVTGELLDSRVYVDSTGWSFDHVGMIEEVDPKYWEYYDHMMDGDDGTPIPGWLQGIWSGNRSQGMYNINVVVNDEGRSNFLAMTLMIPLGMSLHWTEESVITLFTVSGDDITQYDSNQIYFSKEKQRRVYNPCESSVVMTNDGSWDTGKWQKGYGRILATIEFPFNGNIPDRITDVRVSGVRVFDTNLSSSDLGQQ